MKNTHLLLLLGVLTACSTTKNSAPVVEHHGDLQKGARVETVKSVPVVVNAPRAPDAHGYYTVKKGDGLLRIALDHGQNYRDLVVWNKLANPNDIKIDQVLRVLPPESGLTTGSVVVQSVPAPGSVGNSTSGGANETRPSGAQPVTNKNWPNGEKRPYSEAVLAELQKTDAAKPDVKKAGSKTAEGSTTTGTGAVVASATPATANSASPAAAEEEHLTWIWPVDGKVIAGFDDKNKGLDIAGKAGQQVMAAGSGKVMYAGSGIRGYGNLVIVKHSNTLLSAYAHNQSILVKEGQTVSRGQPIAEMGSSDSESVKLHFEIRQQGKPVDPIKFLPGR